MMPSSEVNKIISLIESKQLPVWVDGGWGVDALLGRTTRDHQDLDIAIKLSDTHSISELLIELGYHVFHDEMPTRLEMRDSYDHRVDLHPLTFDAEGNGLQELQNGSSGTYTVEGLSGTGAIDGQPVKCLSPAIQMRFHRGYEPDENDRHDVDLLAQRFGLEKPEEYR